MMSPRNSRVRLRLLGTAAIALLATDAAFAQQTAPSEPGTTAGASSIGGDRGAQAATVPAVQAAQTAETGGLSDIIVTARRRVESVQSVPVAVTAISAEQVQQRDLTSLEKIAAATPQFTVARASNGAGAQLTLRGIGSSATSIGIEQSVAIVVDSVYYGQGRIINEGFFDLARVEILKGPQALFFGKNATAGVISLTTADPGSKPEYIARVGYEVNAQQPYAELIASQPLTDTLGVRLAVRGVRMYDGYYKNSADPAVYPTFDVATGASNTHVGAPAESNAPKERELIGRLTLKWEPTDALTVTLKASGDYDRTVGNGWNYVAVNCVSGVTMLNPSYRCKGGFHTHQNDFPTDIAAATDYARDGGLYNIYKSHEGTGTINYRAGDITLTSITNYNWNRNSFACDCDFLGGNVWASERSSFHAFSEEARAQTDFDAPVNLMIGGLYQTTKRKFFQDVLFAGVENSAAPAGDRYVAYQKISDTDGKTLSGYGQVIWKVVPKVEVTGGVRYIHETKDSFFTQPYVNPLLTAIFRPQSAPVNGTLFGDQTFNNWSPEVTVSYKPSSAILVYGAYKSAYKSGGFSNSAINSSLSTVNPSADLNFQPEKGRGFEGGIKSTVLDNQLRLNLVLYSYKYTDLQVDYFNAQIFAYQTYNAGSSRSKGAEFEFEYAPRTLRGFSLHGTANYNRARYIDFISPCYSGETLAQGCNLSATGAPVAAGAAGLRQDLSGAPTAIAPKFTGTLGVAYESRAGSNLRFGTNVDVRYSASYIASSFGDERTRQARYAVLDAGVRVGAANDRWELALIGKNLTNHFYFLGGGDAPLTGSGTGTAAGVGADILGYGSIPRTLQVQATLRY